MKLNQSAEGDYVTVDITAGEKIETVNKLYLEVTGDMFAQDVLIPIFFAG